MHKAIRYIKPKSDHQDAQTNFVFLERLENSLTILKGLTDKIKDPDVRNDVKQNHDLIFTTSIGIYKNLYQDFSNNHSIRFSKEVDYKYSKAAYQTFLVRDLKRDINTFQIFSDNAFVYHDINDEPIKDIIAAKCEQINKAIDQHTLKLTHTESYILHSMKQEGITGVNGEFSYANFEGGILRAFSLTEGYFTALQKKFEEIIKVPKDSFKSDFSESPSLKQIVKNVESVLYNLEISRGLFPTGAQGGNPYIDIAMVREDSFPNYALHMYGKKILECTDAIKRYYDESRGEIPSPSGEIQRIMTETKKQSFDRINEVGNNFSNRFCIIDKNNAIFRP